MKPNRFTVWIYGFTLFSLFFGAGNLILPPHLGLNSGSLWWVATLGFSISAVVVPMLGILAHARLQGGLMDFGKKISPGFSLIFAALVYGVSLALAGPRTAAVVHELAVSPYLDVPTWVSSLLYFGLVFWVVVNRTGITSILGKWLTPALLLMLLILTGKILFQSAYPTTNPTSPFPLVFGLLEGYQTYDALGAVVAGGVLLVSMNLEFPALAAKERFWLLWRAGIIAAFALLLLYAVLAYSGAQILWEVQPNYSRTDLLTDIIQNALGSLGTYGLSVLITLACFTTAVGIVAGTADFVKTQLKGSEKTFLVAALVGCLIGVGIGMLPVSLIIAIGFPVLKLIYPLTVVLILINVFPDRIISRIGLRWMVGTTLLFSLLELLLILGVPASRIPGWKYMPLMEQGLGWLLPFVFIFALDLFRYLLANRKAAEKV